MTSSARSGRRRGRQAAPARCRPVAAVEQQRAVRRRRAARPSGPSRRSARPATSGSARMQAATSAAAGLVVDVDARPSRARPRAPPRTRAPPSSTGPRRAAPAVHDDVDPGHVPARPRAAPTAPRRRRPPSPSTAPVRGRPAVPTERVGLQRCDRRTTSSSRAAARGVRRVRQRHGQAQPAVVVGVLADQVDPAGRREHPDGRAAVPGAKRSATASARAAGSPGSRVSTPSL